MRFGFSGLTAVTVRGGQGDRSMAALFRGSRNLLLRWNKHVDLAFGNVFAYFISLCCSVRLRMRVQREMQAEHSQLQPVS